MVLLTVKGTKYAGEFAYECTADTDCASLAKTVCEVQNQRHLVSTRHLSALELLRVAEQGGQATASQQPVVVDVTDGGTADADGLSAIQRFREVLQRIGAELRDTRTPQTAAAFEDMYSELVELATTLFPGECTSADGSEAAVARLYQMHDDPNLDEDKRETVYHCRAIMDRTWRNHELEKVDEAGLWFSGKLMEGPLSKYSGRSERSRLTVRISAATGCPPSTEPRVSYDEQRSYFSHMQNRRGQFASLEPSELSTIVAAKTRCRVHVPATKTITTSITGSSATESIRITETGPSGAVDASSAQQSHCDGAGDALGLAMPQPTPTVTLSMPANPPIRLSRED